MPCETESANSFEEAQLDVERREQNAKKRRTMLMWRNAIEHTWETRPMSEIHKLIERQPKIQQAIIDAEGGRVNFWIISIFRQYTTKKNRWIWCKIEIGFPPSIDQPPKICDFLN